MAFFPMWPACYVIFLLIQLGVVTASDGACTRLDETNGTRVSCNWLNNMCDSESRNLSYPNWECFAANASGPWSMICARSNTVELASPWLCPTGLNVYTLSFHFQVPQDLLPEQLELFVIKGPESLQRALESPQANFISNFSPSTGIWFGNASVSCPDCKFQIKCRISLPDARRKLIISVDDKGFLPPEHFSTDKFYATWIAGIVILLVVAVVPVACLIFWWRKKGRARGAEEGGGDEGTIEVGRDDTNSGMDSGGSAATTGIAVSANGSAGSAQQQQAKNKGDNPPSLQRDGAMPSPSHGISATPKPSPVSEENQYSAPVGENYDHGYYLEPITDPHATPEPDVRGENLYDVVTFQYITKDAEHHQPIFSSSWQFSETFTSYGGQLQAMDSDVILTIPEKAVNDGSGEEPRSDLTNAAASMCTVGSKATGLTEQELFTPGTTSQRQETASVDSKATAGVTIHGAITTDVKGVHETLKLTATESICSPVVEYYAGENVMFKKPVCISLPHFLPPDVNENDVRVFQVNRKCNEEICSETLRLVSKLEGIHAGGAVDAERVTGTFHLTEENRIMIVTNHFTGYFCTHCKQQMDPPYLQFRLYATEIEKKTGDVDLTILIWDLRLGISDFHKPWAPDSKDEMTFITSTKLERLRNENVDDVRVGVWIRFPPTETDEPVWMHKSRPDGTPWLKPNRSFDLQVFFPCLCHTEPERVEWNIQCRKDPVQLQRSECYMYVDVGYVRQDGPSFDFLQEQHKSTLSAFLKVNKCSFTHSAVSPQASTPMETGQLQGAMANPPRSDSNSSAGNLLHGPGSLPPSYHHTPSFRHQGQPTLPEGGFGPSTVVNIGKVSSNHFDLASILHPQENGMESYFEQNMRSATGTSQNGQASDRTAADQNGEETAMTSVTSSAWQDARSKKRKQKRNRRSRCTPPGQCPTQSVSNGEGINEATQVPIENAGNVPQELSTSSTPLQNSENRSSELKIPVPCSADVSGTNGNNVSENGNVMLKALEDLDLVEDTPTAFGPITASGPT